MTWKIAIGIPTAGRPDQLSRTLLRLTKQTRKPNRILVCPAGQGDFDRDAALALGLDVQVVLSIRGLSAQRNAIVRACANDDLLIFFDDDFYPAADYIQRAEHLFHENPEIVVATNHPTLDGASGRGVTHEHALSAIAQMESAPGPSQPATETYAGYGCNMIVRLAPVREHGVLFDENLPLYSWLEDVDFSRQLARYGRVVKYPALRGVHLGNKGGRTSGVRFGYSQIANPLYMCRKGSMNLPYALKQMGRNLMKNTLMALWPEPWVDRAGRIRGNWLALRHLVSGKLHPSNIKELE
jgi:GT2 family glycosyltransferase